MITETLFGRRRAIFGRKTNNEAEYNAAILLLKAARERGAKELKVYGDSKLVVCQLSKQWKINPLTCASWQRRPGLSPRVSRSVTNGCRAQK